MCERNLTLSWGFGNSILDLIYRTRKAYQFPIKINKFLKLNDEDDLFGGFMKSLKDNLKEIERMLNSYSSTSCYPKPEGFFLGIQKNNFIWNPIIQVLCFENQLHGIKWIRKGIVEYRNETEDEKEKVNIDKGIIVIDAFLQKMDISQTALRKLFTICNELFYPNSVMSWGSLPIFMRSRWILDLTGTFDDKLREKIMNGSFDVERDFSEVLHFFRKVND